MNRTNFGKGINEEETLDSESGKVVALLGALPRVEAPSNFDFGVKARIARGAPRQTGSLIPFLKLAAPLSLLLVVGAFVFFYSTLPSRDGVASVDPVAPSPASSQERVPVAETLPPPATDRGDVSGPNASDVIDPAPDRAATSSQADRTPGRRSPAGRDIPDTGSSTDEAVKAPRVIMAPGTEAANPQRPAGSDIPVEQGLDIVGITATFADSGWKVTAVKEHSIAARMGVETDDVIEAVDGKETKKGATVKGDGGFKSIRVRREGKLIDLTVKP